MITEEHVMATLAHFNPVPDVEEIDLVQVGTASYLATLEKRSSEVTQLSTDKHQPPRQKQNRPSMLWMAAALIVAVLGVAAIFMTRSGETPVASTDIAVAESLMNSWNTEDGNAISSHFTADGVFDATREEPAISEVWVGRSMIADRTAGYSQTYGWDASFDYTDIDGVIVFNRNIIQPAPTDSGTIGRPQGVAVTITNGLIESFVIESPGLHFCIGDTTTRCKVWETGEVRVTN